MQTNCRNCGASTSTLYTTCSFCKTIILPDRLLDNKQREEITRFAKAIETRLKASKDNEDPKVFGGCLVILALIVASWTAIYQSGFEKWFQITLGGLIGFSLFAAWGGLVNISERNSCKTAYKKQIKSDIEHFLEIRNFYRYEFDTVASETLHKLSLIHI